MRLSALVFAFLVGCVAAIPVETPHQVEPLNSEVGVRNSALEQLVLGILEEIRELMVTGSDTVPVLDPLNIDNLKLDLGVLGFNGGHIEVTNFVLNQLSSFVIDKLSITSFLLIRYTVEVEAHLPAIDFESENYDLDLTVVGFRIFGNGDVSAKVTGPKVKATVVVVPRISLSGLYVQISSADIQIGLDTFEPKFTGIFGNEEANDFINVFLETLIPEFMEYFESDISALLSRLVLEVGNDILEDWDIGSILGRDNVQTARHTLDAENMVSQ